jgi:hypothetical protein
MVVATFTPLRRLQNDNLIERRRLLQSDRVRRQRELGYSRPGFEEAISKGG